MFGPAKVDLSQLLVQLSYEVYELDGYDVDPLLIGARFADLYRDLNARPPSPEAFDRLTDDLDDETWKRLALIATALEFEQTRPWVQKKLKTQTPLQQLEEVWVPLAEEKSLLVVELLNMSPVRQEELARCILDKLQARILRESAKASKQRLEEIDYRRLLGEAEAAKEAAEERLAELRRIQEERQSLFGRSKW